MTIHTFGDSHGCGSFGVFENIKINQLGAILCYSFGREKLKRLNIKNHGVEENDSCIFSFGEIDCRCHIKKHVTDEKTYQSIIDELVINYFEAVYENVLQYKNINVYIYNVVPPPQIENTWNDHGYPFIGTDEERKNYVLYFNQKIKEYCLIYGYNFFDIYDHYIDKNGYLDKKYSDDHVHIKDSKYIIDYVNLYF
jgi:hypothetical protein